MTLCSTVYISYVSASIKDLPADLRGSYFRNGPAKFRVGSDQIMHPFDGDGMVAAVTFDGKGRAHFRSLRACTEERDVERMKTI